MAILTRMDEEGGFLQALQSKPGDNDVIQVYADWLEERGDSRADFLRLRVAVEQLPEESQRQDLSNRLYRLRGGMDPAWLTALDRVLPPWPPLRAALDMLWASGGEALLDK